MQNGLDWVKSAGRAILDSNLDRITRGSGPGKGSTSGKRNPRGCERRRRFQATGFGDPLMAAREKNTLTLAVGFPA